MHATAASAKIYDRRAFLKTSLLSLSVPALGRSAVATATLAPGGIRRELFLPSPQAGVTVLAATYYTRAKGRDLISIHQLFSRSDTVDQAAFRYSSDNGRSWSPTELVPMSETLPQGRLRKIPRACLVDPTTGQLVYFTVEGVLPNDDPIEGMKRWTVRYSLSSDGGMTWHLDEEIIVRGPEFNADHPMPGVNIGRNGVMIGDIPSAPIFIGDGTVLLPVEITPVGPDGSYFNPGGGLTYTDVAVLRGNWDKSRRRLEWALSARVAIDPHLSTRGLDEPTLAVLPDGRILMVMRGSNATRPSLPGRRWACFSIDMGRTWSEPRPWIYSDGDNFFSPSSSSELITHSSGRIFWVGNICPANPRGNAPRYPIVIGEVERRSGLLIRNSIRVIDDRAPHETHLLALASPSLREDRETGEIVLNLTRWGEHSTDPDPSAPAERASKARGYSFTASAYLYRVPV